MAETAATGLPGAVKQIRAHLAGIGDGNATVTMRAATRLVEGLTTAARMRRFDLTVDEPAELGGADRGPNPVELVLAALGTCQEIVYAVYAAAAGVRLDQLEVDVEGDLDPRGFFGVKDQPAGFSRVRMQVRIESPASRDEIAKLVAAANEHCPVLDVLTRSIPVDNRVELNGRPLD